MWIYCVGPRGRSRGEARAAGPFHAAVPASGASRMNATSSNRNAATHTRARYKRPFDLGLIAAALVLLLPVWVVLGAAIALAIRIEDGGPVLYRHRRLGRGGRPFEIVKFRSMVVGAENRTGPVRAAWRDTRRTRVGRVLRRCHLDELPQVINVLAGEMSLVGPRSERPEPAARIEREVPGFSRRLRVDPGITGLFQARGHYHLHPRHKLRCDDLYIATMSPWLDLDLDLALCAMCVRKAVRGAWRPAPRPRTRAPNDVR